jgi:hypothetical protein
MIFLIRDGIEACAMHRFVREGRRVAMRIPTMTW